MVSRAERQTWAKAGVDSIHLGTHVSLCGDRVGMVRAARTGAIGASHRQIVWGAVMAKWDWLEKPTEPPTWGFFGRVILKAAGLFALCNIVFAALNPMEALGRVSLYNILLPGRERLPYGENPAQSYNISLYNIPAMFASHVISRPKAADEYRVVLIGDSATWGWRLENKDTLAGQINAMDLRMADRRRVVVYNLGYPVMSLTKDVLLLDEAMGYQPDQIVWLVTLESLPRSKQLFAPIVQNNESRVLSLVQRYSLYSIPLLSDDRLTHRDFWGQTIIGQRRNLADLLRLQLYGFSWAATGIDQYILEEYAPRQSDFDDDTNWYDFTAEHPFTENDIALDMLEAGIKIMGSRPVTVINEPIFISSGQNSDLRYNSWYPRWAYDAYRTSMLSYTAARGIDYLDLWDMIDPAEFTDSPVHLTPEGTRQLAERVAEVIVTTSP
jgi:lysophospholipase L1-like esterase